MTRRQNEVSAKIRKQCCASTEGKGQEVGKVSQTAPSRLKGMPPSRVIGLNDLELFYVTEKAMVTCLKLFSRRLI